ISIYFPAWGRENSAEGFSPCKMVKTSCMTFTFFHSLSIPRKPLLPGDAQTVEKLPKHPRIW
ncbi:hypothetical protein, partial [Pseudoflavonifractor capillosus]|uniref:hypothetical protein n=1 Tax=Pseudoflavonifractor capillosus TaxID=106588 RepID=UPI0019570349